MTRVLLVDDHALIRSGFAMVLSAHPDLEVVGQAVNGQEAVEREAEGDVDVVLMDVQMPVLDGIAAAERIVAAGRARVVILTTFDREDYLMDALRAGASGFLLKNAEPEALVDAVRAVADGQALLAPEATLRVVRRLIREPEPAATTTAPAAAERPPLDPAQCAGLESLTEREQQVLRLMADGLSNDEIAAELVLGRATIKTHVSNVLSKTGSRDRVQAVILAHRAGLAS